MNFGRGNPVPLNLPPHFLRLRCNRRQKYPPSPHSTPDQTPPPSHETENTPQSFQNLAQIFAVPCQKLLAKCSGIPHCDCCDVTEFTKVISGTVLTNHGARFLLLLGISFHEKLNHVGDVPENLFWVLMRLNICKKKNNITLHSHTFKFNLNTLVHFIQ